MVATKVAWQDVKELFGGTGHILRVEVMRDQTGKSHAHGVVIYASEQDAQAAVDTFHNYLWKGQRIQVSRSKLNHINELVENVVKIGDETIPIKRQFYVDNLPDWVRWQDLKDIFFQAGTVLRTDIAAKTKQNPRHSGVVLFASRRDAKNAIEMFHNYEWNGQQIKIREDVNFIDYAPPEGVPVIPLPHRRQRRSGGRPTKKMGLPFTTTANTTVMMPERSNQFHEPQIYVNNLPIIYRWQELKQLFSQAGQVIRANILSLPNGQSRRFGTVLFASPEEARMAIELFNGYVLDGNLLHVRYDRTQSNRLFCRMMEQHGLSSSHLPVQAKSS
ncbi:hypothetical protein BDF19DRAFT_93434 [Syncephalis fuscata]|nr:hypothetical protein BDF19DRAFT_93434 [Syncephalis fuscata]